MLFNIDNVPNKQFLISFDVPWNHLDSTLIIGVGLYFEQFNDTISLGGWPEGQDEVDESISLSIKFNLYF